MMHCTDHFYDIFGECIILVTALRETELGEMSKFQRCGHQLAAEVGNNW